MGTVIYIFDTKPEEYNQEMKQLTRGANMIQKLGRQYHTLIHNSEMNIDLCDEKYVNTF